MPERQWRVVDTQPLDGSTGRVPLFADCAWYGANPDELGTIGGDINPAADYNLTNPGQWLRDMGRLQMLRHANRGINMSFQDGSTSFVPLEELWSFKWHREFTMLDNVDIPWN